MLKGPTGCGKTRFVEHMAWRLGRPLVTVACHDDLSASDLTGRYLIRGGETVWLDGPLTLAARLGAICYLDEIIEARTDTVVVIHPLTDDRRILPLDKAGELLEADPNFQLVVSYNPGYQHGLKDLKPSTRQRFVALEFGFPPAELESAIVAHEGHVDRPTAHELVTLTRRLRQLGDRGLAEVPSTRLIVAAARLRRQRHPDADRVRDGAARPADRRSGSARGDARPRQRDDVVGAELVNSRTHGRTRRSDPRRRVRRVAVCARRVASLCAAAARTRCASPTSACVSSCFSTRCSNRHP